MFLAEVSITRNARDVTDPQKVDGVHRTTHQQETSHHAPDSFLQQSPLFILEINLFHMYVVRVFSNLTALGLKPSFKRVFQVYLKHFLVSNSQ